MKTITACFILFAFTSFKLSAQKAPLKWGKISSAEKELNICEFDSLADAVILYDYGNIDFTGRDVYIDYHKRIKILDEKANDQGNIVIRYYHNEGIENLRHLKAQTILFENGEMKKIPLDKKDFFDVKVDEFWSEIRFSFPSVQKGAILEYKYQNKSESALNLESWAFQSELPTLHSELSATIGNGRQYKIFYQGNRLIQKYLEGQHKVWTLNNLPAIKDEDFCPNPMDYVEMINFQLTGYYTRDGFQNVLDTWEELAKRVLLHTDYRKIFSKNAPAKKIIENIISDTDSPDIIVKELYDYVIGNYTWNHQLGILPDLGFHELQEKKAGSGVDLNVLLVHLLQTAGLEANPVLISTKSHGIVSKSYPLTTQFNHVIAQVEIDGQDILIDATSTIRPYDLLAKWDLNKEGFLLHKKAPRWVSIEPTNKTRTIHLVKMDISNPEAVKYKLDISARAYDAVEWRSKLQSEASTRENLLATYFKANSNLSIDSFQLKDFMDKEKPFSLTAYVTDRSICTINDDYLYLSPFVDSGTSKNPFEVKPRYLPVDFYYPKNEMYVVNIEIPNAYEVLETPQNTHVKLSGDKAFLKIGSVQSGNNLQVILELSLIDPLIPAPQYFELVELYDLYISKREEQIVLKKKP